jgi:hypothetical protein
MLLGERGNVGARDNQLDPPVPAQLPDEILVPRRCAAQTVVKVKRCQPELEPGLRQSQQVKQAD